MTTKTTTTGTKHWRYGVFMGTQCVSRFHTLSDARLDRDTFFPTGDIAIVADLPNGELLYQKQEVPIIHRPHQLAIGEIDEITGLTITNPIHNF